MIKFTLTNIVAQGAVVIMDGGKATQTVTIINTMSGLPVGSKQLEDTVTFEVDSSLSISAAWANIQAQAQEWFAKNYVV